jgi:spore germination protein YaaH
VAESFMASAPPLWCVVDSPLDIVLGKQYLAVGRNINFIFMSPSNRFIFPRLRNLRFSNRKFVTFVVFVWILVGWLPSFAQEGEQHRSMRRGMTLDSLFHTDTTLTPKNLQQRHRMAKGCERGKWVVYGFHPYWEGSSWKTYDFGLLSHLAYFAAEIDMRTGYPVTLNDWPTTLMVDSAQAAGCKVHLTVTPSYNGTASSNMLRNSKLAQICIDTISYWVRYRKADGVCVDFEDLKASDSTVFADWMGNLKAALLEDNPNAEVTVAGYATQASTRYSLTRLNGILDYMVVMGYDFWGSWSTTSGCTAPLVDKQTTSTYNLNASVEDYLTGGMAAKRLVLAVPYYGNGWTTQGSGAGSTVISSDAKAYTFSYLMSQVKNAYVNNFDSNSLSSFYTQKAGSNYSQIWVCDSNSVALRFQLAKDKQLAGVGMWALGYDQGQTQLWDLLEAKFSGCTPSTQPKTPAKALPSSFWESYQWTLPWVCGLGLLLLALILIVNRKARQEVMNRYLVFPFVSFVLMALLVVGVHWCTACFGESASLWLPLLLVIGTVVLVVGYVAGRKWSEWRNREE